MKKTKRFITILLMMAVILGGCGNKSKEELTDIEQFRCSSSIETVFKALGKSEILTWEHNGYAYCKYENLNLWGYKGEVIFEIRDDMDTISEFYCTLTLNKKELSNLISIFDGKYSLHETKEYGKDKLYEWNIDDEKAEELGYDTIYISDKGDKKVEVSFFDKYTIWKDEAYYQHLEEEEQKETELNVIASEKYKVDGEDVGIILSEKDGTLDISIMGNANSEEKASIMLATYVSELEKLTPLNSYSVCVFCDKLFVTHSKNSDGKTNTYGTNADGSMAFSAPDWLKTEITMTESELNLYVGDLLEKLVEFSDNISNNSIIE